MWFLLVIAYILIRLFISEYRKEKAGAYAREVNKNYKPCYYDEKIFLERFNAMYGGGSSSDKDNKK